jgi:hypothetical protein
VPSRNRKLQKVAVNALNAIEGGRLHDATSASVVAVHEEARPTVQQFSWLSRFGPMLIEVRADAIYVNGQRVEQVPPDP